MTTTKGTLGRDNRGRVKVLGVWLRRSRVTSYAFHAGKIAGWGVVISWFPGDGWSWAAYPLGLRSTYPSAEGFVTRESAVEGLEGWMRAVTALQGRRVKR